MIEKTSTTVPAPESMLKTQAVRLNSIVQPFLSPNPPSADHALLPFRALFVTAAAAWLSYSGTIPGSLLSRHGWHRDWTIHDLSRYDSEQKKGLEL